MRCPRCGNENPKGNRFCGMCGATMLAAEVPAAQVQRAATPGSSPSAQPAPPVRPRTAEPVRPVPHSDDRPSISGPSFLGLSDPAPRKRNAGLSIDPHASSGNLDYLLDDEEEHRGSGAGKVFLILIALALVVGLGYLRWKGHGFGWLSSPSNKPSAVAKNPDATDSDSTPAASSATPDSQTPSASQPAAAPAPAVPNSTPPAAGNDAANSTAAPASTPPAGSTANKNAPKPESAATAADSDSGTTDNKADDNADNKASDSEDSAPADKPTAAAEPLAPKPRPASKPAQRTDAVAEAQKYLYGRGTAQDCERGLRLLKPAANAANPKAMVEMGALYSAGLCTPHDLPTAYRWFAMALRKDPENQAIQADLQKLWGEMTQPERQLAIKLTQ